MSLLDSVDDFQRRHTAPAVAVATYRKFSEDHSTNMAAMIAFWAFFSIFPLFLVLVTSLGWLLPESSKEDVLSHVADMFPLLDPSTVGNLSGSWWPLVLGVVTALWSGTGVIRSVQFAFNSAWEIPYHERPGLFEKLLRSLGVLATIGLGLVLTTVLSSFVTTSSNGIDLGAAGRFGGYAISALADIGLFVAAFRILTDRDVSTREVLPGALLSGIAFFILQQLSALIVSRYLNGAESTYGHFATVITILWWFYLQSIVTLLGAQLNVVREKHLYPRSLSGGPETEADRRVLQAYAAERAYHPEETVTVDPGPPPAKEG